MAVRPNQNLEKILIRPMVIAAAGSATAGLAVKATANDGECTVCGAGDRQIGIAMQTSAVAGAVVDVALLQGGGIIPVTVGTGGATYGKYAACAADGLTDQLLGGGTTVRYIAGIFMQTGVVGDQVGLLPGAFAGCSA